MKIKHKKTPTKELLLTSQIKLRELKEINKKIEKELKFNEKKNPNRHDVKKINKIWKFGIEIITKLEDLNEILENRNIEKIENIESIQKLSENFKEIKQCFNQNLKNIKHFNLDEYYTSSEYLSSQSKSKKEHSKNKSQYDSLSFNESLLENENSNISHMNFQEQLIRERKKDIKEINSAIMELKKLKSLFSEILKKDDVKIDMILKKQKKNLDDNKTMNENILKSESNQNKFCKYLIIFGIFIVFIIFGFFFYYLVLKTNNNN